MIYTFMKNLCFRLRLEWKVFQRKVNRFAAEITASFRLRLEWKVFQLCRTVKTFRHTGFRLRLEWKVFQPTFIGLLRVLRSVSVSVWSGRYFNNDTFFEVIDDIIYGFRLRLEWKVFQRKIK